MKDTDKIDLAFVILHYLTTDDTIACIESIIKCVCEEFRIVVVDNASTNTSFQFLKQRYETNDKIVFLKNIQNLGFAQGNNVGIQYAREKFHPEFVCVLNNDTLLLQDKLYTYLKREYEISGFAVAGPMILTGDGRCNVNPGKATLPSYEEIQNMRRKIYLERWLHIFRAGWLFSVLRKWRKKKKNKQYIMKEYNVILHGCFFAFSVKYFEVFDGFCPNTFLYFEEEILHYKVIKSGLKTVYIPDIIIYHKEDGATSALETSSRKSYIDKLNFMYESVGVFLEQMELEYEKGSK